jgi:hypothetical protein
MYTLKVHWINPTRAEDQKRIIESSYEARLLELCGGADNAAEMRNQWHRACEAPIHHWVTYNKISMIEATVGLTPTERKSAAFKVEFKND